MKNLLLLALLVIGILALKAPAPPVWPQTFSQDFVDTNLNKKIYESGKIWYDFKNYRQRVDYSSSNNG